MKLFQYAIIKHPTKKEQETGSKSTLLREVSTVLASDVNTATIMAAREIPSTETNNLENVEIVVRPF